MKTPLTTLFGLFSIVTCMAQWTPLNSTTPNKLNDVDFLNENYGVIVGNANTLLLTVNGGVNWTNINNQAITGDIYNVKVISTGTIVVSTYDPQAVSGRIYLTQNAGLTWTPINPATNVNHRIDLEMNAPLGKLFAAADSLRSSADYGVSWETPSDISTTSTTTVDLLRFADGQTGHFSGNVGGFATYSAFFYRTEDGGEHWYAATDPQNNFPSSAAQTTMCFVNPNVAYVFMNEYSQWAPSAINKLVKIFDFNAVPIAPGDSIYGFSNQIMNSALPDYMNDAFFENLSNGFALGNTGKIYRTTNGGTAWTVDYTSSCSTCALLKMDMVGQVGYAVGENGILVKYQHPLAIDELSNDLFSISPNPSSGLFTVKFGSVQEGILEIVDPVGKQIVSTTLSGDYSCDLSGYAKGVYFVRVTANGETVSKKIVLQ